MKLLWCGFYGAGIIVTLGVYGLLQQRIMQIPFSGGVLFTYSSFLVLCNRICNFTCAMLLAVGKGEKLRNQAPLWKYVALSFFNVGATTCQYEALKFVSFPVSMLAKSFKMIPVMLWGMVISGKRRGIGDWMVALFVTGGVTMFLLTGPIAASDDKKNSLWGLLLLGLFLALDGLTSTFQEKLFVEQKTSTYNQMFYVNFFSSFTAACVLIVSGELMPSLAFCAQHPAFLKDFVLLSASATTSQFFIYSQIKEFGALVCAATMNVRQVASILLSYIWYGNSVTDLQIVALLLVIITFGYKSLKCLPASQVREAEGELGNHLKTKLLSFTAGNDREQCESGVREAAGFVQKLLAV